MSDASRRSALAALDAARPAIARLDTKRDAEDVAADLIEGWSAVETALRSLVGGTSFTGQALIREARQRQLLSFEQANALAEFNAARERVQRTDYRPSQADIDAARDGFLKLESGLMHDTGAVAAAPAAPSTGPVDQATVLASTAPPPRRRRGFPVWLAGLIVLLVIGIVAALLLAPHYSSTGRANASVDRGAALYQQGQREAAVGEFNAAIRDDPHNARAHVYLARMAREVGNMPLANQEAVAAVRADSTSALAQRELGSVLLAQGRYDLAARFYSRAIQLDNSDKASMGWLGCAVLKQGNVALAQRWFQRAGAGPWMSCAPPAGAMMPAGPVGP